MARFLFPLRLFVLFGVLWSMTAQPGATAPPAPDCPPEAALPPMNSIIQVSRDLASAAAATYRVTPEIVDEVINGAKVDGCGTAYAIAGVEFLPCDKQASLEIVINTRLLTETQGVKDPVTTFNSSVSTIQSRKPVQIDAHGLTWQCAYTAVSADICLKDLTTRFHGVVDRVVKKIALRVYDKEFDKSRTESEYKTGKKSNDRVDMEVDEQLARGQKQFLEDLRRPLEQNNILPEPLLFRTSCEVLTVVGRLVDEKNPPVIPPPPALEGAPAVAWRGHESLLNTGADRLFAGKTFRSSDVEKQLASLGIELPKKAEKDPKEKKEEKDSKEKKVESEVTFTKEQPIRVAFDHDTIRLTLRVADLKSELIEESGEELVTKRWEITAVYKLALTGTGGIRLERVGELQSKPLDEQFHPIPRLSGAQIAERRRLHAALEKELFKKTQDIDEIRPTGDLAKIGTLQATQAGAANGWLVLAWKRVPEAGAPVSHEPAPKTLAR